MLESLRSSINQMSLEKIKSNYVLRRFKNTFFLIPLYSSPMALIELNSLGALFFELIKKGYNKKEILAILSKHFNQPLKYFEGQFTEFISAFENRGPVKEIIESDEKINKYPMIRRATLELTGQCNLNCFHCYAKGKRKLKDMSTKKILSLLDEMVENDTLFLSLTGGEVFKHKDFPMIYEQIRLKGFIPSMISNGSLLNDDIFNILVRYPPAHIKFSLYGSKPETHEFVTRVKGSFNKTISAVKRLTNAGIDAFFGATLFKETAYDMDNMKKLAGEIGIHISFGAILLPSHEKDKSFFTHSVNEDIVEKANEHNTSIKGEFVAGSIMPEKRGTDEIYDCINGLVNFTITSDGSLVLCVHDLDKKINLNNISLKDGLEELKVMREKRLKIPKGCKNCPLLYNLFCN